MHVLIAPDKFRGTATAPQAALAMAAGVAQVGGTSTVLPLGDGGEGTLDALGGPNRHSVVTGPAGNPVRAGWRLNDTGDAVIEMAQASGLLLAGGPDQNDPWSATSRGTGELIAAAAAAGARRVIVGLGGSATTDGGLGALEALLEDEHFSRARHAGTAPELIVCCDVQTPFFLAARIFGPQKGAGPRLVLDLEQRLRDLEDRYLTDHGLDVSRIAGAGAAGGLAGGLAVLGGRLTSGFDMIADTVDLDGALAEADLVITGEGRLDDESFNGKVVGGVTRRGRARGIPIVAAVGDDTTTRPPPGVTVLSLVKLYGREPAMSATTDCLHRAVVGYLGSESVDIADRFVGGPVSG